MCANRKTFTRSTAPSRTAPSTAGGTFPLAITTTRAFEDFGTLRVFNDDTLDPGAVWPLHPHRDNEVVTYCAGGEFRHADERGEGGVLRKGWVQHTTVGRGMWHSEINNLPDRPMRFIQMWFYPSRRGLKPAVEQKAVEQAERTDRLLPLVSNRSERRPAARVRRRSAVELSSSGAVASLCSQGRPGAVSVRAGRRAGLVNGIAVAAAGSAMVSAENSVEVAAEKDAELLVVDVRLDGHAMNPFVTVPIGSWEEFLGLPQLVGR